jgi:hypothetical protein
MRARSLASLALAVPLACPACWVIAGVDDRPVVSADAGPAAETGAPPIVVPPLEPGCDATKDPSEAPCLVSDGGGVFVAPLGDDASPGTKAQPLRTIAKALAVARDRAQTRVFICDGTYPEALTLGGNADGIGLYGGFACADWRYTTFQPKILPPAPAIALKLDTLQRPARIQDLEIAAPDAVAAGTSSIAVFVTRSQDVAFKRVKLVAGKGASAAPAPASATNQLANALLSGNGPQHATAGALPKTCTCPVFGTSTGGGGGHNGFAEDGQPGSAVPTNPAWAGVSGMGGYTNVNCATSGGNGYPGGAGAAVVGGSAAAAWGTLTAEGWTPSLAAGAPVANPGQGGGGGGAKEAGSTIAEIGGGGGGCGSCGGAGGSGGRPGGSSIALLSFQSTVELVASALVTANGAAGGQGGTGETASQPGAGAGGWGCAGGSGGRGAGGSGGGGGTGGLSVGILYRGAPLPKLDGAPIASADTHPKITLGAAGGSGPAGPPGAGGTAGNAGSAGLAGIAKAVVALPP